MYLFSLKFLCYLSDPKMTEVWKAVCQWQSGKVNYSLSLPCIYGLAASQHKRCRSADESSILPPALRFSPSAESAFRRRLSMLMSFIRMVQAFRDYQRNLSELSRLSDRELADIGLDRSDIPRVAAGSYNG